MHIDMPIISNENSNFVMIFDELDRQHHDKALHGKKHLVSKLQSKDKPAISVGIAKWEKM